MYICTILWVNFIILFIFTHLVGTGIVVMKAGAGFDLILQIHPLWYGVWSLNQERLLQKQREYSNMLKWLAIINCCIFCRLFGSENRTNFASIEWAIISIDFDGVFQRNCTKADYWDWAVSDGVCIIRITIDSSSDVQYYRDINYHGIIVNSW